MSGKVRKLCALLLVLLFVAAHLQGVGGRGGKGGGGFGLGGGRGGGVVVRKKRSRGHGDDDDGHHYHNHSSAAGPRGQGLNWRVSGGTATLAAAALVW